MRTLAYLLAIPVVGYLVATGILWDLNKDAMTGAGATFDALCAARTEINDADLDSACSEIASIQMLKTVSLWCGIAGIAPTARSKERSFDGRGDCAEVARRTFQVARVS